jgi:hypothetical protein
MKKLLLLVCSLILLFAGAPACAAVGFTLNLAVVTNVNLADGQVFQENLVDVRTNFPTLSSPSHPSAGHAQFFLNGLGPQNYLIQYSTNLGSTDWSPLLTTNGGCAPVPIVDSNAVDAARYYRAVIAP